MSSRGCQGSVPACGFHQRLVHDQTREPTLRSRRIEPIRWRLAGNHQQLYFSVAQHRIRPVGGYSSKVDPVLLFERPNGGDRFRYIQDARDHLLRRTRSEGNAKRQGHEQRKGEDPEHRLRLTDEQKDARLGQLEQRRARLKRHVSRRCRPVNDTNTSSKVA